MNRTQEKIAKGTRGWPRRWMALSLTGWGIFLVLSCSSTMETSPFETQAPAEEPVQEAVSFSEAEFRFAMIKLENGDFEGSRETLTDMAKRDDATDVEPKVEFALGVIKLLDMAGTDGMKEARDYFQAFVDSHPGGPYREAAQRIVLVLDSYVKQQEKEQQSINQLTQQVSDQEQVIQNLGYKIEKLEEIHRETEEKRHLLEGE